MSSSSFDPVRKHCWLSMQSSQCERGLLIQFTKSRVINAPLQSPNIGKGNNQLKKTKC